MTLTTSFLASHLHTCRLFRSVRERKSSSDQRAGAPVILATPLAEVTARPSAAGPSLDLAKTPVEAEDCDPSEYEEYEVLEYLRSSCGGNELETTRRPVHPTDVLFASASEGCLEDR